MCECVKLLLLHSNFISKTNAVPYLLWLLSSQSYAHQSGVFYLGTTFFFLCPPELWGYLISETEDSCTVHYLVGKKVGTRTCATAHVAWCRSVPIEKHYRIPIELHPIPISLMSYSSSHLSFLPFFWSQCCGAGASLFGRSREKGAALAPAQAPAVTLC